MSYRENYCVITGQCRELVRVKAAAFDYCHALKDLIAKLDECKPHIDGAFQMVFTIRGHKYEGPTYEKELKAARALVEKGETPLTSPEQPNKRSSHL